MSFTTTLSPHRGMEEEGKIASCLSTGRNRMLSEWTVDQLDIRPYQHILEIGFGPGYALEQAAGKLKVGLLAGIDESMNMFQKAFLKNRKLVRDQLLQLHLGKIESLPYPHHYFHTIFASNVHSSWKDPLAVLARLSLMLKTGGRLVMSFQPEGSATELAAEHEAERLAVLFDEAGLERISLATRNAHPAPFIAATGFKGVSW